MIASSKSTPPPAPEPPLPPWVPEKGASFAAVRPTPEGLRFVGVGAYSTVNSKPFVSSRNDTLFPPSRRSSSREEDPPAEPFAAPEPFAEFAPVPPTPKRFAIPSALMNELEFPAPSPAPPFRLRAKLDVLRSAECVGGRPAASVLASRPSRFDVASQSTAGTDPDPDRDEGSPPSFALGVWDGVSPLSLAVANPSSSGGAGRAAMSSPSDSDTPPAEGSADSSSRGSSPSRVPSPDAKANAVRRSSSSSSAAARASASARAAAAASHAAAACASAPSESRGVQSPARSRDSSRDAFFRKRCAGDPRRESSSSSPSALETIVLATPPPPEAEGWNPSS